MYASLVVYCIQRRFLCKYIVKDLIIVLFGVTH